MTTFLTIDAGIAFKLITPHTDQQKFIDLVNQWQHSGYQLCAPTLWVYEVTSIFTKMVHFGEISEHIGQKGIHMAYDMGVQLMPPDDGQIQKAFEWTRHMRRVSAYDSFYLALAETLGCEFWTIDRRLANAAAQSWVKLAET